MRFKVKDQVFYSVALVSNTETEETAMKPHHQNHTNVYVHIQLWKK